MHWSKCYEEEGVNTTAHWSSQVGQPHVSKCFDLNASDVDLEDSDITDDDLILIVERLKLMPELYSLNLKGNQITSIEGLSGLVGLT